MSIQKMECISLADTPIRISECAVWLLLVFLFRGKRNRINNGENQTSRLFWDFAQSSHRCFRIINNNSHCVRKNSSRMMAGTTRLTSCHSRLFFSIIYINNILFVKVRKIENYISIWITTKCWAMDALKPRSVSLGEN